MRYTNPRLLYFTYYLLYKTHRAWATAMSAASTMTQIIWSLDNEGEKKSHDAVYNQTRRALGRAHVSPRKVFQWLGK